MLRLFCLCLITAALLVLASPGRAQNAGAQAAVPPNTAGPKTAESSPSATASLAMLEQAVRDRTAEWDKLSQSLEPSLSRLLPCDPKIAAAFAEVTKASEARLAAIAAYLEAANRQALLQTNSAGQVLASAQGLRGDLAAEKSGLAAQRAGLDGQLANLTQSAQRQASLTAPQDALRQILAVQQQRSDTIDSALGHVDAAATALGDLTAQLQSRFAAWNAVQTAFEAESIHWNAYYIARQARSQTECTITKGATAPRGKQK